MKLTDQVRQGEAYSLVSPPLQARPDDQVAQLRGGGWQNQLDLILSKQIIFHSTLFHSHL